MFPDDGTIRTSKFRLGPSVLLPAVHDWRIWGIKRSRRGLLSGPK